MQLGEQEALLDLWMDFLNGRRPSGALMREFYFDVVSYSRYYRYGMAPEVFDLLINGPFSVRDGGMWSTAYRSGGDHRAA
jgi:hypothetical protein